MLVGDLRHVNQFMHQDISEVVCPDRGIEYDAAAVGVASGADRSRRIGRLLVGMDPDLAQAAAEALLEQVAGTWGEGTPGRTEHAAHGRRRAL
jgi:hypothetical protein